VTARAGRAPRGDAGVSLPELMVGLLVSSILLGGIATTFLGTLGTTRVATSRVAQTTELKVGMDSVTRVLRYAVRPRPETPAFEVTTARRLVLHASLVAPGSTDDPPPTRVELAAETRPADPGCGLWETRSLPTVTSQLDYSWSPAASIRTRCLLRGQVNPVLPGQPQVPVFTVQRRLNADPTAPPGDVESVSVRLRLRTTARDPLSSQSTCITLPNLVTTPDVPTTEPARCP
jgi:type II secretory pathway pseudopilin PulG